MEIITAPANLAFTVALVVVLLLGAVEVVSLLFGAGLDLFDLDGPDADLGIDVDADGDVVGLDGGDALWTQLLGWLHVGQLPIMILLILFLLNFGIAGLVLQTVLKEMSGAMLAAPLAITAALLLTLPATRMTGGILKQVLPRDQTEAVSRDSFIGHDAQITIGTARRGAPAEARLRDNFGRSHYVMVEPDQEGETFSTGSHVLILKRHGDIYQVVENSHAVLED